MISPAVSLRYIMVDTVQDLLTLGVGKLSEGARCIVRQPAGDEFHGNREYILTKQRTGSISFSNGRAPNDNVVLASGGDSLWVAQRQFGKVTLTGTSGVQVSNVFVTSRIASTSVANVSTRRISQGTSPGTILVSSGTTTLSFQSSDASDDGTILWALFPNF